MSFLTPLYIAGLTAVALPILFHLIRRIPRDRREFSSFMFLTPSPPRITRRSRLDHWLLLLLRALAVILLTMAFARPFFREAELLNIENQGRRVAVLVDVSASMRRGPLWQQAVDEVQQAVTNLGPLDDVGLFAFSDQVRTVVGWEELTGIPRDERAKFVASRLGELAPTWAHTDLGRALTFVADACARTDEIHPAAPARIVLVSDLQHGTMLHALESYDWPSDVMVTLKHVRASGLSNASLRILDGGDDVLADHVRVRVANAEGSDVEQFNLAWRDRQGRKTEQSSPSVFVPAGESRIFNVERGSRARDLVRLELTGDDCSYDNSYFHVVAARPQLEILFWGDDAAEDVEGLRYYLELACRESPFGDVQIAGLQATPSLLERAKPPHLVCVTRAISAEQASEMIEYLGEGGTILCVPKDDQAVRSLAQLDPELTFDQEQDPDQTEYLMLDEIDFQHPMFASLAKPSYNDFTQIHFWNYRSAVFRQEPDDLRVVARFDNGCPRDLGAAIRARETCLFLQWLAPCG